MRVGVVLMAESGSDGSVVRYADLRALALRAEEAGLDSIWVYDHLLFRDTKGAKGQWEVFSVLAALAEATERVTLGPLVAATAFRNPAMTAKIATTIDEISNGRFVLGLGAGWNEAEFEAFGFPYDHRVSRFEDALRVIVPLVREGRADHVGRYATARDALDLPRGPRPQGPPILIGGTGPRTLRLAAEHADIVNSKLAIDDPEAWRNAIGTACHEAGRDPATLAVSYPAWAAFPDLGPIPDHMANDTYGSAEAFAEHLASAAREGIAEAMVVFHPNTPAGLERVVEAVSAWRDRAARERIGRS